LKVYLIIIEFMDSKQATEKTNEKIKEWAKETPSKLIVGLDGYTGIGKTTLLNNLAFMNSDILPVNRDDFLFSREIVREKLSKAIDRSKIFELEVCDDKKMEDFINAFKKGEVSEYEINTFDPISGEVNIPKKYDFSKKIMMVEGVFMFHPELPLNKLWDKKIYLEGDIEKIDERRIKREKEKWGKDYFPETHPDSYFRQVTTGLKRYIELYKPKEIADLVIKMD